jgi:hypothetical protein
VSEYMYTADTTTSFNGCLMRRTHSLLLTAGLVALAAVSAQAQPSMVAARSGPVAGRVAAEQWEAKPLGTYDVVLDTPDHPITVTITISETSGKLVALFWPTSDDQGQVMDATVIGTDLVLSANTRRGAFELNIERRGKSLSGFWMLGNKQGSLKGEVTS